MSPYGRDGRVEARSVREAPHERDQVRLREERDDRRGVAALGSQGRRHVGQRDVQRLVERATRSLAEHQVRVPLVADLDVGDLDGTVHEVVVRPDGLALTQGPQLGQQVEGHVGPDFNAAAGVEGMQHAVVRAYEDERPPVGVVRGEARVIRIGRRIERRRIENRRRRVDNRAQRLRSHLLDEAGRVDRREVRRQQRGVRRRQRHHAAVRQRGVDVALVGRGKRRHPQARPGRNKCPSIGLGRVGLGLVHPEAPQAPFETRQGHAGGDHDIRALRHLGAGRRVDDRIRQRDTRDVARVLEVDRADNRAARLPFRLRTKGQLRRRRRVHVRLRGERVLDRGIGGAGHLGHGHAWQDGIDHGARDFVVAAAGVLRDGLERRDISRGRCDGDDVDWHAPAVHVQEGGGLGRRIALGGGALAAAGHEDDHRVPALRVGGNQPGGLGPRVVDQACQRRVHDGADVPACREQRARPGPVSG